MREFARWDRGEVARPKFQTRQAILSADVDRQAPDLSEQLRAAFKEFQDLLRDEVRPPAAVPDSSELIQELTELLAAMDADLQSGRGELLDFATHRATIAQLYAEHAEDGGAHATVCLTDRLLAPAGQLVLKWDQAHRAPLKTLVKRVDGWLQRVEGWNLGGFWQVSLQAGLARLRSKQLAAEYALRLKNLEFDEAVFMLNKVAEGAPGQWVPLLDIVESRVEDCPLLEHLLEVYSRRWTDARENEPDEDQFDTIWARLQEEAQRRLRGPAAIELAWLSREEARTLLWDHRPILAEPERCDPELELDAW